MARRIHRSTALGALVVNAVIAAPAGAAGESTGPALRRIEVPVQVAPSNFAYGQGKQLDFGPATPSGGAGLPPVFSPGVSVGAALGINLLANVVASGIEAAAAATARAAVGPVGASVKDVDLRATDFESLRALRPEGRYWRFVAEGMRAEQGAVTYRYERTRKPNQLLAAAYCSAEQITEWSQDIAPGLSWTEDVDQPPNLVTRTAQ